MTMTLYDFILMTFDETELLILCDGDAELKKALAEFSSNMSLREKTRRLLAYCERHGLSKTLRTKVKEERNRQWQTYKMPENDMSSVVGKNKKEAENIFKEIKAIPSINTQTKTSDRNITQSLKVFICHATADKPKALNIYNYLKENGFEPWIDSLDILPGQKWKVEIQQVIESSDVILVCLSNNSVTKEGYVQKEIRIVLDKALEIPDEHIFLIPARFEDCEIPRSLEQYHWVDLFKKDGYSKLLKSLHMRAKQLKRTTNFH